MRRHQIKQSFSQLADGALDIKAMTVLKALQGNVHFPNMPDVVLLEEYINQFHDAIKKAGNRGRAEIAEKNKIRQQIIDTLQQLAEKVGLSAGGDRTKLVSSGFDLARNGTAQTIIDAPELLQVKNGINPGDMIVKVTANRKARGYNHEYAADPISDSNTWTTQPSTRSRHVFKGLQQGKKYWFRTIAVGSNGQTACSKQVSCVVL